MSLSSSRHSRSSSASLSLSLRSTPGHSAPESPILASKHTPKPIAQIAMPKADLGSPAAPAPTARARSVGSMVAGVVSRAPPRLAEEEKEDDLHEDDTEDDAISTADSAADAEADTTAVATPAQAALNLPSHAASRTHCPLCSQAFDLGAHLPILLHAGHSFCASCVLSGGGPSGALAQVGAAVVCPVCRLTVAIPSSGASKLASLAHRLERARKAPLDDSAATPSPAAILAAVAASSSSSSSAHNALAAFPINFLLLDRLELHLFAERVDSGQVPCARCDDPASATCATCEEPLCAWHQDDHRRSKATKSHVLRSIQEFLEEGDGTGAPPSSISSRAFCQAHPTTEVELFCLQCEVPICVRCSLPSGGTKHCSPSGQAHPTEDLRSASTRAVRELTSTNTAARDKYNAVLKGMAEIQKTARAIGTRELQVADQITAHFNSLHEAIDARKTALLARLNELVETKNYTLNVQQQTLYGVARAIEDANTEVDEMLASVAVAAPSDTEEPNATISATPARGVSSAAKLLHVHRHLVTSLEALLKYSPAPLHPEDSDQFAFIVAQLSPVPSSTSAGGRANGTQRTPERPSASFASDEVGVDTRLLSAISKSGTLGDCLAIANLCTASGPGLIEAFARLETRFTVQTRDRFGQVKTRGGDPVAIQFLGPKGSASGRIMDHANGTYTVRFVVLTPGVYNVVVSIHGRHISGSPFRVLVHGATDGPLAIGREWLASWASRGSGPNHLANPMGLACARDGTLHVADFGNHRLACFAAHAGSSGVTSATTSSTFLRTIGKTSPGGSEHATLKNPWAVAIDPLTQQVFVSDSGNHRIQVFNGASGEWVRSWGTVGSKPGQFRSPAGITIYTPVGATTALVEGASSSPALGSSPQRTASPEPIGAPSPSSTSSSATPRPTSPSSLIDGASNINSATGQIVFVSDREKHRVQAFDVDGRFLFTFGTNGSGPGQFLHPSGCAVDPRSQRLYICDQSNHRVQVFSLTGSFLTMWGVRGSQLPGQFVDPVGLAVDREGLVYVADATRVQVFAPDGTFLRLLGSGPSSVAGGSSTTPSSSKSLVKPTALAIVSLRADGTVLQLHEDESSAATPSTPAADGSTVGAIVATLVFVSDATHRLHVFK